VSLFERLYDGSAPRALAGAGRSGAAGTGETPGPL